MCPKVEATSTDCQSEWSQGLQVVHEYTILIFYTLDVYVNKLDSQRIHSLEGAFWPHQRPDLTTSKTVLSVRWSTTQLCQYLKCWSTCDAETVLTIAWMRTTSLSSFGTYHTDFGIILPQSEHLVTTSWNMQYKYIKNMINTVRLSNHSRPKLAKVQSWKYLS